MLLSAITRVAGVRRGQSAILRQNNQLLGWPWIDGTFSWVEPTSWCLLALKKAGQLPSRTGAAARIAEADRMLADRCCVSGGWNYGNSNVLGKELSPVRSDDGGGPSGAPGSASTAGGRPKRRVAGWQLASGAVGAGIRPSPSSRCTRTACPLETSNAPCAAMWRSRARRPTSRRPD